LSGDFRIWWISGAVVEYQKEQDEDDLIGELAPTLHKKRAGDLAATMQTVFFRGDLTRSDGVLHTRCCSHRILASNTNAVEEERPDVADDPAILRYTPSRSQHDETEQHDGRVLDQTPASANPVTNDTNEYLTYARGQRIFMFYLREITYQQ
jgi:hypothetical protein